LCAALTFCLRLGATDLWAPDEPRFAQVAEELRSFEHGTEGLVVLRLNDAPYTQKPPLYYWVAALLGSITGHVGEVAARLPSAAAGFGCIWLTYLFATSLTKKPTIGLLSAGVLLTVYRFSHFARRASLDVILTFFILLALYALFRLYDGKGERGRWFFCLHAALGLAVLTKGPVGLLPVAAFALFLVWQGNLKGFPRVFPLWSFVISLGPALAWIACAVMLTPPGFFEEAVTENLIGRFFSGTAHVRSPFYYFAQFPLEFLPWSLLWPIVGLRTIRTAREPRPSDQRAGTRLLLAWVGLCFVFFSISAGKRGLYLLPTYPAVAILCAVVLDEIIERRNTWPRPVWISLGLSAALAASFGGAILIRGGLSTVSYPGFELPISFGIGLLAVAAVGSSASWLAIKRGWGLRAQISVPLAALLAVQGLVFVVAYPAFDGEKSPAPISHAAAALAKPGAPIGVFDHPAMTGGVAYYSGHPVANLRSASSIHAFLDAGGRSIIVKKSKLDRVPGVEGFEIRAERRSGARTLVIIAPTAGDALQPRT